MMAPSGDWWLSRDAETTEKGKEKEEEEDGEEEYTRGKEAVMMIMITMDAGETNNK